MVRRQLFQTIKERNTGSLTSVERNILGLMKDLEALEPVYPNDVNPNVIGAEKYLELIRAWETRMDVYDELMEAVYTINSRTIKPKGVLYAEVCKGKVSIGYALLNPNFHEWNKDSKQVLLEIARDRAWAWVDKTTDEMVERISPNVLNDVYAFALRAKKYFKNEEFATWINDLVGEIDYPAEIEPEAPAPGVFSVTTQDELNLISDIMRNLFGFNVNIRTFNDVMEEVDEQCDEMEAHSWGC